jgi:hypothetical protein
MSSISSYKNTLEPTRSYLADQKYAKLLTHETEELPNIQKCATASTQANKASEA